MRVLWTFYAQPLPHLLQPVCVNGGKRPGWSSAGHSDPPQGLGAQASPVEVFSGLSQLALSG